MPKCPPCFTSTEWTATECHYPSCLGPSTPAADCTRTMDLRPRTTTVVDNPDVCSITPTVTSLSACPTATPCNEADCAWVTLGDWGDVDVTRTIRNCRPSSTPWTQPLPPGYTPGTVPPPHDTDPGGDLQGRKRDLAATTVSCTGTGTQAICETCPPCRERAYAATTTSAPTSHRPPDDDDCDDDDEERETYTRGLCPTYSCSRPTASCSSSMPRVTRVPTTQTTIHGCTTTLMVGVRPCSACPSCVGEVL